MLQITSCTALLIAHSEVGSGLVSEQALKRFTSVSNTHSLVPEYDESSKILLDAVPMPNRAEN